MGSEGGSMRIEEEGWYKGTDERSGNWLINTKTEAGRRSGEDDSRIMSRLRQHESGVAICERNN